MDDDLSSESSRRDDGSAVPPQPLLRNAYGGQAGPFPRGEGERRRAVTDLT